ncbi:MAG: hypothetical protein GY705_04100, partial [Bacteroidetes bacterium]|nr:hypothetical protein [Bacteroidota bacterium]
MKKDSKMVKNGSNVQDSRIVIMSDNKECVKSCLRVDSPVTLCRDHVKIPDTIPVFDVSRTNLPEVYLQAYNNNVCPINVLKFQTFLKGYDIQKFIEVVDIVSTGVHISSEKIADPDCSIPVNQSSTKEFSDLVNDMLMLELKEGRIAGPFLQSPPGLIVSPLGAVPKKEKKKIRI